MTPLPPNSTPRFRVLYTNSGQQHSNEWRSHASPAAMSVELDVYFTAIQGLLTATVIDDVLFAADGSNVFNSVSMDFVGNTYGSGAGTTLVRASYVNFVGRSSDGRRVRVAFFGTTDLAADFRFVAGESSEVDDTIAALQDSSSTIVTIGDLRPVWKTYANAGFNAYWQRAERP